MAEKKLLLATGNAGKIAEFRELLSGMDIQVLGLGDTPQGDMEPPEETGATFEENAIIKARCWMERTGLPVIADDSGLAVDALNGEPGVRSARYAGPEATTPKNNALLLERLSGVPGDSRAAEFHCCIALCRPGLPQVTFDGKVEGVITESPAGENGFGYDPLFFYPPMQRTFAQLSSAEKNRVSHRADALRKLALWLESNPL